MQKGSPIEDVIWISNKQNEVLRSWLKKEGHNLNYGFYPSICFRGARLLPLGGRLPKDERRRPAMKWVRKEEWSCKCR